MTSVKLADCCSFFSGGTPEKSKAEYWSGPVPWFSPKDIKSFDLLSAQDHISEIAAKESATRIIAPETILVVGRSGVLAHTLPVGVVRQPSAFNQDIKALVPNPDYDAEFLALYLKANQARVIRHGVKRGPTVHSLIAGFLEDLDVPCIPLQKQRRIGTRVKALLAEVETARQAVQAQFAAVQSLKCKALEAVFDCLDNWKPIGSFAKLQSGYAFKSELFKQSGVRLLRNTNILPGKVYWDDSVYLSVEDAQRFPTYRLAAGDVLISLDRPVISSGVKVARVSETDLPALLLQRVGRFILDPCEIDPGYLYAFLQTNTFIAEVSGHEQSLGVPHISPVMSRNLLNA
jgi:type I restriction enzyme, S subunit